MVTPVSARSQLMVALVVALAIALIAVFAPIQPSSVEAQEPSVTEVSGEVLELFEVSGEWSQLAMLRDLNVEVVRTLDPTDPTGATATQRIIAAPIAADQMRALGLTVDAVRGMTGQTNSELSALRQGNRNVWREYNGAGGIREEIEQLVAAHPDLTKLVTIGQSVQGQPIYAIKVTADAQSVADGSRPASGYISGQHAREWITVETNRRFLHHVLDNSTSDPAIRALLNTTELWFVIVANPDGYDYTFSTDRLWRKNLADNNGNGSISLGDGVDLNRNFASQWGYDDEGSSPEPNSEVYRGPAPMSEPETIALDQLFQTAQFEFFFNIHSAVGIMLYGVGWQVATASPDDYIGRALLGDDAVPAIPGYNPGIGAELYIVNGDTNDYAQNVYDSFTVVMELETCDQAEALLPDDAFGPFYCELDGRSVFEFPDDETLIEIVFQRNLPLYLAAAQSAVTPDAPVSISGYTTPGIQPHSYDVAHGATHAVSADAKRSLGPVTMRYQINGGSVQAVAATEWGGGERYGDTNNAFYAEVRGEVSGTTPGDTVTVWFSAGGVDSESFSYSVAASADVLVVAHEDYDGFSPEQPGVSAPLYAQVYVDALTANGLTSQVWDVVTQGVPDHLGVLAQYDRVVWELGDNQITQEASDAALVVPGLGGQIGVAEQQHFLTLAMRDYLNEGGKLLAGGQYTGWFSSSAQALGGYLYGKDGEPSAPCVLVASIFDCLLYSDDFAQYWLGINSSSAAIGDDAVSVSGLQSTGPHPLTDTSSAHRLSIAQVSLGGATGGEYPLSAASYTGGQTAAIATLDTVAMGFGLESVVGADAQAAVLRGLFTHLGADLPTGPTCRGMAVTVDIGAGQLPTAGDDVILGTEGDDAIAGGDGDDVICGLGGNDAIWGQGGADVIEGGDGDDKLRGGDGDDMLDGNDGADDIAGGRGNDTIRGGAGDDTSLRGGTGDDWIEGNAGNDLKISGNGGADQLWGNEGDDSITGGPRPDFLYGGAGADLLRGFKGADQIFGESGDDDLRGGAQPDLLDGGDGADTCNGGTTGDDAVEADTTADCESVLNTP